MGTGSHLGLSFSELGVLMSTPSSEKDSLLGPLVLVQMEPHNLKKDVFLIILLRHLNSVLAVKSTKKPVVLQNSTGTDHCTGEALIYQSSRVLNHDIKIVSTILSS